MRSSSGLNVSASAGGGAASSRSGALGVLFELNKVINDSGAGTQVLLELGQFLGLFQQYAQQVVPAKVQELAEARQEARTNKDFQTSDQLRDKILAAGFVIEDTKEGYRLVACR